MDDKEIVEDIRRGGEAGVTYLFNTYKDRLLYLFKYKFNLSHDDAEDVLQEVFIRFINSVREDKYRQQASIWTFLSKIGSNECSRKLAQIAVKCAKEISLHSQAPNNDDEENEPIEIASDVNLEKEVCYQLCVTKGLERFEKKEKKASECLQTLTLHFESGSIEEIAKEIGRTKGATREFIYQCYKKIKPYLQSCWDDCRKL